MRTEKTIGEIFPRDILKEIDRIAKKNDEIKATIFKEYLEKNIEKIEKFSGLELDPGYLAYVLEYAYKSGK